jgi:lysosomal Pro-X carboxypeptidase
LDGCIAGSAPIANFESMVPPYNADSFAMIETLDASTAGGANDLCRDNIRTVWNDMLAMANTTQGLQSLGTALRLCAAPQSVDDVWNIINGAANAIGFMAMSSYPYPSAYLLLGGKGKLPAYPMRVGCKFLTANFTQPIDRITAFGQFVNVYFNATKNEACINASSAVNRATEVVDYLWGYLACTTMFMPFSTNGVTDMFWASPWNATAGKESCFQSYGVWPQAHWIQVQYGGRGVADWGSNIVFSNGQLDPWRPGGIQRASSASRVRTVVIPDVGHHIDLMWNDPKDTPAIRGARAMEVAQIKKWISEKQQSQH